MKPVFEKIPQDQRQSFHCEIVRGADYGTPWHFHPELELTLTLKSRGHRMVGDNISVLRPGDLVFVGSNLPHVWHQDREAERGTDAVHAIVVQFKADFLGESFMEKPELQGVRQLFRRASRGLQVAGRTREAVARKLQRVTEAEGLERLLELLDILRLLAASGELKPIASLGFSPTLESSDYDRMERVCRFIHEHLGEVIEREQVAAQAHLSPGAFSRFFKTRTGMTLTEYVNELRIGRVCRLLAEADQKITDVAMECGFTNIANFNRQFLRRMEMTPRAYRNAFKENSN
jgi:AraC-like DNA-binding protein